MTVTALPFENTPTPTAVPGLGARIRISRSNAGYARQIDLLTALQHHGLEITQSTLSAWECDRVSPRLQDMILIADLCGVTLDYLAGRSETPTPQRGVFVSEADAELLDRLREHFTPQLTETQKKALAFVNELTTP